ncbi:ankyrin repeat domain-containing protein [Shewanella sp. 202IG2-18]|uniref:ankyrin repeat domain-containing protein n=1 Tax=Parashewanella hymeniacidonis TaxID=2807618 RepID=UPI001960AA81|nr:ankyrin repeat domain-containing protein [Parashewanella hymeniacidonis]MBM7074491.1 ankyrin repeat domain-containing protein [Parashewanella hymeniacidonis]
MTKDSIYTSLHSFISENYPDLKSIFESSLFYALGNDAASDRLEAPLKRLQLLLSDQSIDIKNKRLILDKLFNNANCRASYIRAESYLYSALLALEFSKGVYQSAYDQAEQTSLSFTPENTCWNMVKSSPHVFHEEEVSKHLVGLPSSELFSEVFDSPLNDFFESLSDDEKSYLKLVERAFAVPHLKRRFIELNVSHNSKLVSVSQGFFCILEGAEPSHKYKKISLSDLKILSPLIKNELEKAKIYIQVINQVISEGDLAQLCDILLAIDDNFPSDLKAELYEFVQKQQININTDDIKFIDIEIIRKIGSLPESCNELKSKLLLKCLPHAISNCNNYQTLLELTQLLFSLSPNNLREMVKTDLTEASVKCYQEDASLDKLERMQKYFEYLQRRNCEFSKMLIHELTTLLLSDLKALKVNSKQLNPLPEIQLILKQIAVVDELHTELKSEASIGKVKTELISLLSNKLKKINSEQLVHIDLSAVMGYFDGETYQYLWNIAVESKNTALIDSLLRSSGDSEANLKIIYASTEKSLKNTDSERKCFYKCFEHINRNFAGDCLESRSLIRAMFSSDDSELIKIFIDSSLFSRSLDAKPWMHGITPYLYAVYTGKLSLVDSIGNKYPQVMSQKTETGQTALHLACQQGRKNIIQFLISQEGVVQELKRRDTNGNTALYSAVESKQFDVAILLLETFPELARRPHPITGDNLLHYALVVDGEDAIAFFKLVVSKNPELLYQSDLNIRGESPLARALQKKPYSWLDKCIFSKEDFDFSRLLESGLTPLAHILEVDNDALSLAVLTQNELKQELSFVCPISKKNLLHFSAKCPKTFKFLLPKLSEKLFEKDIEGWLPQHHIIAFAPSESLELILDNELVNIHHFASDDNKSPVMLAVEFCNLSNLKALLDVGATLGVTHFTKEELLFFAAQKDSLECLKYLVEDSSLQLLSSMDDRIKGKTILDVAVCSDSDSVVDYLLVHFPKVYEQSKTENSSPLVLAVKHRSHKSLVRILSDTKGQSDKSCDERGYTACHLASEQQDTYALELFKNHQALCSATIQKVDSPFYQYSPLMLAAREDKHLAVQVLMTCSQEVQLQTVNGMNACHIAAINGSVKSLNEMKSLNSSFISAEYSIVNKYTPLCLAAKHGQDAAVELLIQQGTSLTFIVGIHNVNGLYITPYIIALINGNFDIADRIYRAIEERTPKQSPIKLRGNSIYFDRFRRFLEDNGVKNTEVLRMLLERGPLYQ